MTILSRPNSIVSDCSSLGQLDDVTPFTSFEADPLNLGFQTKQCSFGSLNVNSLLGQDRLHQICLPPLLNHRYPTNRTFEHYPFMSNFFVNSFFPYSIKQWDQLDPELRKEHDFAVFKAKLKETIKPSKFKHFNVGYKYPNQLHTQLRVGRSSLNSHLYPIGLSNTKSCPCGFANESVEHFLLDCIYYQNIRGQLYQKLEGLLEKKLSTYSKKDLVQIMLCGEKPHLPEKFYHNKSIFFSLQTFLLKTKRLIAYNKPRPLANAPPPLESD